MINCIGRRWEIHLDSWTYFEIRVDRGFASHAGWVCKLPKHGKEPAVLMKVRSAEQAREVGIAFC